MNCYWNRIIRASGRSWSGRRRWRRGSARSSRSARSAAWRARSRAVAASRARGARAPAQPQSAATSPAAAAATAAAQRPASLRQLFAARPPARTDVAEPRLVARSRPRLPHAGRPIPGAPHELVAQWLGWPHSHPLTQVFISFLFIHLYISIIYFSIRRF